MKFQYKGYNINKRNKKPKFKSQLSLRLLKSGYQFWYLFNNGIEVGIWSLYK